MLILILIVFVACGDTDSYEEIEMESPRETLRNMEDREIIDYIIEEYSLSDMISYYGEEAWHNYLTDALSYPNMYLIVEELESQGYYDEIINLYEMADKIGYDPAAILGEYFYDNSTSIIHSTNGSCLNDMKIEDRKVVSRGPSELLDEINDDDIYLKNYTFCEECMGSWE